MEHMGLFEFSTENALELVVVFEPNGSITYANKAAKMQLEYDRDLSEVSIKDIFPNTFAGDNGLLDLKGENIDIVYDEMAYRGNRTCFPVKARFTQWKGQFICTAYNASNENFLEKKASQADKEVEEALKVKSQFVANITHELRTPVNGILGNTQRLMEMETEKEKIKLLNLVERGCRDMHSIINNVLDFSKLEAGKFALESRKFHFRNMMDYVESNHSHRIIEKGLEFSIEISPEIPEYIIGDELRIVQVLNNLISNAYKFTSVGKIHVEVVKTAETENRIELFFMVMDTGIGIAKASQDKLFKSFSQVDASISRKYGGTGLGLNISKQLTELMGGDIFVESELGKGTVFSFSIWAGLPGGKYENDDSLYKKEYTSHHEDKNILEKLKALTESSNSDNLFKYGEKENTDEIQKKMSKLILSMEMDNWEKAEMFAESIKQLVAEAPSEIKSAALRLKMSVQKGDYEKATKAFDNLNVMLGGEKNDG